MEYVKRNFLHYSRNTGEYEDRGVWNAVTLQEELERWNRYTCL